MANKRTGKKKKSTAVPDVNGGVNRSMTLNLYAPESEGNVIRNEIIQSIRTYRAWLRKCFGIMAACQSTGASIATVKDDLVVKPDDKATKAILEASTGLSGVFAYGLRKFVLDNNPNMMSFVWDSLRRDLETAWKAKDPKLTKASRSWLVLQGVRDICQFNRRGIGFPAATARPKFSGSNIVKLKWNHEIGPIEFTTDKLAGPTWWAFKAIRDGLSEWKLGTVYLNEHDGRLKLTISYTKPADKDAGLDPKLVCHATFLGDNPEKLLLINGPNNQYSQEDVAPDAVVAMLKQCEARRAELERRRAACGNPRRVWGHRHGWSAQQDVLSRCSERRTRLVKDFNHAWSRRIVTRAKAWGCGMICYHKPPEKIHGFDWAWAQFMNFLQYKAAEAGIVLACDE